MEDRRMQAGFKTLHGILVLLVCCAGLPARSSAQVTPAGHPNVPPSRVDLFGGYAYFHPYDGEIAGYAYQPVNLGVVTSLSGYFNRYVGLQAESGFHPNGPNDCVYSAQGGPIFRLPMGRFVPFAHVLGGGSKIGGPVFQPCTWGWGVTSGAGFDYILPGFGNHIALRVVQADWQYSHVSFGPLNATGVAGGEVDLKDYRLASGIVFRFGAMETAWPVQASCSVQSQTVFVGDPVTVSLDTTNLNPKKRIVYSWTSTGGPISGTGDSITVDTTGLAQGSYTVTGKVTQGRKPTQRASCSAIFTVRAYEPPIVSCLANPSVVTPGETSVILAHGISPQNRPLTYSFSADGGQLGSLNGNKTTLGTNGVPIGKVTITCNVVDDLHKSSSATTTVTVIAPPPPPPPTTRALCSQSFERDRKRPVRVNNEAKGCLDGIALTLKREPDAKLEIVGHSDSTDKPEAASERALNIKRYLTVEKGIDPSRVELRTGTATGRTVDAILVPAGASFTGDGTVILDESRIKTHGQSYGTTAPR